MSSPPLTKPRSLLAAALVLRLQAGYAVVLFASVALSFLGAADGWGIYIPFILVLLLVLAAVIGVYAVATVILSTVLGRQPYQRTVWRWAYAFEAGQAIACVIGLTTDAWPSDWRTIGALVLAAVAVVLSQAPQSRACFYGGKAVGPGYPAS